MPRELRETLQTRQLRLYLEHEPGHARRACPFCTPLAKVSHEISAQTVKIGRPGYKVTKQFDPDALQRSLLFQIDYPEIEDARVAPRFRFMSSYEQKVEPWDKRYQYVLFAAEPYETIAFRVPNAEVDKAGDHHFVRWDPDRKVYCVLITFRSTGGGAPQPAFGMPPPPPPLPRLPDTMPLPPPPPLPIT